MRRPPPQRAGTGAAAGRKPLRRLESRPGTAEPRLPHSGGKRPGLLAGRGAMTPSPNRRCAPHCPPAAPSAWWRFMRRSTPPTWPPSGLGWPVPQRYAGGGQAAEAGPRPPWPHLRQPARRRVSLAASSAGRGRPDALTATGAAAVAVCRAVEELTRCSLAIKWVNDLFYGGKKVCGILTEAVTDFERPH